MLAKKFLDADGLTYFAQLLNDYPNNEILGAVIDAIDGELSTKAPNTLATQSTPGLMSPADKTVIDSFSPNIAETLTPLASTLYIANAKQENALGCLLNFEPRIGARIRTTNLLNVNLIISESYLSASGTVTSSINDYLGDFIPVSPGDDIYYTGIVGPTTASSVNRRLHVYTANKTWIKQMNYAGSLRVGDSWSAHGTVPSNGAYVRVSWGITDYNIQITVGAPSGYMPYEITPFIPLSTTEDPGTLTLSHYTDQTQATGQTYNISIPSNAGSIYACQVDPIAGILTSTAGYIGSYNGESLPGQWFSDRDTYVENTSPSIGAQVIYMLDEEDYVEYNLTPIIISMYYHTNYFCCDQNSTILSFIYYAETLAANHITAYEGIKVGSMDFSDADVVTWNNTVNLISTKANIDSPTFTGTPRAPNPTIGDSSTRLATTSYVSARMSNNIAPSESTAKATKDYSVGKYLMYNGQLYKVISPISNGESLTINTNISATDVATELNLLFSQI